MTVKAARGLRLAAQAWTFGVIFLLSDYNTLIAPTGVRRMISPGPLTSLVLAQLADILVVAALYATIVLLLRRFTPWRYTQWVVAVMTALCLGIGLRPFLTFVPRSVIPMRLVLLPLATIVVFILFKFAPDATLRLKSVAGTVFAGFVVFAILVSGELLRIVFWRPAPQHFFHASTKSGTAGGGRLIWFVFDELDYNQTFGHRDASLELPHFDKLRSESTLYTDVLPVDHETVKAVPSFLTGSMVIDTRYTWDNRIEVETEQDRSWHALPIEKTVFQTAHTMGLRNAIVGWKIPYCHAFETIVDECYWTDRDSSWDGSPLATGDSFFHDFEYPLHTMAVSLFNRRRATSIYARALLSGHEGSVEDMTSHALEALRRSQADVIYIHLPVPHPPAGRDRRTHQLTLNGNYLDGLARADDVLGQAIEILQAQSRWAQTTIIVQGDHGWRGFGFTPEDHDLWKVSPQDVHPVLMVHQQGQTSPETVPTEISILKAHDIAQTAVQQIKP